MFTKTKYETMNITHFSLKHKNDKRVKKIVLLLLISLIVSAIISFITLYIDKSLKKAKAISMEKYESTSNSHNREIKKEKLMLKYYTDIMGKEKIAQSALTYCNLYNIPPSLFIAVINTESSFNPNAINKNKNGSIDRGLCQLNNKTFPYLKKDEFMDPEVNIKYGTYFFNWCLKKAKNNTVKALAFYNAGYGNVTRKKVGEHTLNYINKVITTQQKYDNGLEEYLKENSDLLE